MMKLKKNKKYMMNIITLINQKDILIKMEKGYQLYFLSLETCFINADEDQIITENFR